MLMPTWNFFFVCVSGYFFFYNFNVLIPTGFILRNKAIARTMTRELGWLGD